MKSQIILLTGASGSLGFETFKEFWKRSDIHLVLLLRKSQKNIKKFSFYLQEGGVRIKKEQKITQSNKLKIVWGDASCFEDIELAIKDVDWIFNCMGIIPPHSENNPKKTIEVNFKAIDFLIQAIKKRPNGIEKVKFINIGSIAEYGERSESIRKVRVGDPLIINAFDIYGLTKYKAERVLTESGLKYWVHFRLSFVGIPDLFSMMDPIVFNQPLNSWVECITVNDAGLGLSNCLNINDESDFWRKVYNMGGGANCQISYNALLHSMFGLMGMRVEKILDTNWFTTRNQHVVICEDTEDLNKYLHFQNNTYADYVQLVKNHLPFYLKWVAKLNRNLPPFRWLVEKIARQILKQLALSKTAPLRWIKNHNEQRINAFFGSSENIQKESNWDLYNNSNVSNSIRLNHGYDEKKEKLETIDLQKAAEFRGWKLLEEWNGDLYKPIQWQCAFEHQFLATPYSVIKAGHGCPQCDPPDWRYDEIAKKNPFIAQVWYKSHNVNENNVYSEESLKDIIK